MSRKFTNKPLLNFVSKFSIVHTITYLIFGILFMFISNYFSYFESDPIFNAVMKPSDALTVRLAAPVQIIRGALLGLALYPFRSTILESKHGWLKLFGVMYILTSLGAVITGPGSIEGFLYTKFSYNPLVGVPEITLQMLAFSYVFCKWMKRKDQVTNN